MPEPPGMAVPVGEATQRDGTALPEVDPQSYREVLGRFATGVTVVTAWDETDGPGQPWGTTVNSFTAVSLEPPLVLVCVGRERSIHPLIERTRRFGVNILGEDAQQLSDCFAGAPSPLPRSAFCDARYGRSAAGLPLLDDAIAFVACDVERIIPAGDHTIYVARVVETATREDRGWPLLYFRRRYLRIERAATADLLGKADR